MHGQQNIKKIPGLGQSSHKLRSKMMGINETKLLKSM